MKNEIKNLSGKLKRLNKKYFSFINNFGFWMTAFIAAVFIGFLFLGPIFGVVHIYTGDIENAANRFYLLSTIAQSLAAILALGITANLVAVQLVSQTFTPKIIGLRLKDPYFWGFCILYIITIGWALAGLVWIKTIRENLHSDQVQMDLIILLTFASVIYLIPYVYITIRSLKPIAFAGKFIRACDFAAVEEILHSAVTNGFATIIGEVGNRLDVFTMQRLAKAKSDDRPNIAKEISICYLQVGKRALKKDEQASFLEIFRHLRSLVTACTELQYRKEADIFNDNLKELYDYSEER